MEEGQKNKGRDSYLDFVVLGTMNGIKINFLFDLCSPIAQPVRTFTVIEVMRKVM